MKEVDTLGQFDWFLATSFGIAAIFRFKLVTSSNFENAIDSNCMSRKTRHIKFTSNYKNSTSLKFFILIKSCNLS